MTPEPSPALRQAESALSSVETAEDPADRVRGLEDAAAALDATLAEDAG